MKQITLAAITGFERHGRATRKAEFLARMESLMPWAEFCALIAIKGAKLEYFSASSGTAQKRAAS